MDNEKTIIINLDETIDRCELLGNLDANINAIVAHTDAKIVQRDNDLIIQGEKAELAKAIIKELLNLVRKGEKIDEHRIDYVIELCEQGVSYEESDINKETICFTNQGKAIKAKTVGQKKYIDAIKRSDIVFGIGPAGTGKTYLAVAMAISAFKKKEVDKIILARPAVEAGESLGFLPGDLQEKVDPYLRPLYDALYELFGRELTGKLKEKETIEVVPLAYMRGRTLDNAFIILDEAQNTTREQMKMFLTRMGFDSKVVVTGDITQIDLPRGKKSGLVEAEKILKNVDGIEFCKLKDSDVVRHKLVKKIIAAYDNYYKNRDID